MKKRMILIHATTWIKPQKHDAEWKKLDVKDHMLYAFIYIKCPGKQIYRIRLGLPGIGSGMVSDCKWAQGIFWDDATVL